MSKSNKAYLIPTIIAITFISGLWAGRFFTPSSNSDIDNNSKIDEILSLVKNDYVDKIDIDSIIELTIPDMLENLDPHTTYIPAKELTDVNDELEGSFSGIGVSFSIMEDSITIIEIISGGPSQKAGLSAGDRIVTVDGENVAGVEITNQDVMKKLKGPKGTLVKLGIKRNNSKDILNYDIIRGDIPITSIDAAYIIDNNIGYIKVNKFGRNTYNEFLTKLALLKASGAEKYIIDLRGNSGGFMEMAAVMSNEFLPSGKLIVYTLGRTKKDNITLFSDGTGSFIEDEIAVLIDEFSASASEIVAGALQDNDRGLIIGRRSYGKGLVQHQITLKDSSAIRLTVSRYHTPSGRCIQKKYTLGNTKNYNEEISERYKHGETFNADSIKLNTDDIYYTENDRIVYGGGGIMPDIFVPNDTSEITNYYIQVANSGLMQKFAFNYCDKNRNNLDKITSAEILLKHLPSDDELLQSFFKYVAQNDLPVRWNQINISRRLILNQLKALIARDAINQQAFYEIYNTQDNCVLEAIKQLKQGSAKIPITISQNNKANE